MVVLAGGFDESTTLGVNWSKRENNWMITYPSKADGWLMHGVLISDEFEELLKELNERGYDTNTLRISVKKKKKGKKS